MLRDESSPAYAELFGELDFRGDDDARSVYSPAAYFVDLLALLEGTFDRPELLERRPGLKKVLLDHDNTYVETPYLDIVNEVLEAIVGATSPPYQVLRTRTHPLGLPFSLQNARLQQYLDLLQVTPEELYRLFAATVDHDLLAREYLRMSWDDVKVVTSAVTSAKDLAAAYGAGSLDELEGTERLAEALGLNGDELRELVTASPPVTVSADGTKLAWPTGVKAADKITWFDRANRLIRLTRMTGLSITDLDLTVDTYCGGGIDKPAVRALAAVVRLRREHDLTVTDVCRLVVPIEADEVQGCAGDILADRNKDYRFRLAGQINVAESEIVAIVRRYRERYADAEFSPFDRGDTGLPAIGLLHRAGQLASALGIMADELFDVLVALESDPSQRRYTTFPVIGAPPDGVADCFKILEGGQPAESLWLAQTLFAAVAWMQRDGFSGEDLTSILGGRPEATADDSLDALAQGVEDAFDGVAFAPALLTSDRFGERAAKVVHDVLTAYKNGVVSPADDRLLRIEADVAAAAAYDGVTDLGVVVPEDFYGLGLGDRLQTKIYGNLVRLGVLQADGLLAIDTTDDLRLANDFSGLQEILFKMIGAVVNGTAAFYPSDLADLGLAPDLQTELYDNLVFNGYLAEEGDLIDPDFFLEPDNQALFEVNARLDDAAGPVQDLLDARLTAFDENTVPLDTDIFADLRFTDARLEALTSSLMFNGYLDDEGYFTDMAAFLDLSVQEFSVALEFYPQRAAILDAIQSQIAAYRTELSTLTLDDFAELADEVMAARVMTALDGVYTDGGRVADEELFADPAGTVELGQGFTDVEEATVFAQIGVVLEDEKPYRLDPAAIMDLGFDEDERDALLTLLVEAGDLTAGLAVAEDRLAYFRNVNNALAYDLPGFEDFTQDVFFLLHAVAGETAGAVNEIVGLLDQRAEEQHQALYGVAADVYGVPTATAAAICEAITGGAEEALDVLVAPVLTDDLTDPHLKLCHRRIRRFALLAAKLGLDPVETAAVFADQDLVGKFPENLAMPPGMQRFDALLEGWDDKVYLFAGTSYWTYDAHSYALASRTPKQLNELSPRFAGLTEIDAAFTLPSGVEWIIGHGSDGVSRAFTRDHGATRWAPKEQIWGQVRNAFTDPARIDGAFADSDGRTFLFAGDQYVRYSASGQTPPDYSEVDEGYPRPISEWREREGLDQALAGPTDAFQAPDGTIYVISGDAAGWGLVRSAFDDLERLDAAYASPSAVHLFAGGQTVQYSDSVENAEVHVDEGYPRKIEDVPPRFESGIDAGFTDAQGRRHLFRNGRTITLPDDGLIDVATESRWGILSGVLPSGKVDSALAGLDGSTYLFSGTTYLRYSTDDYSAVDPGYPQSIAKDWAGLTSVDASFVMDGATYLFGAGGMLFELPEELYDDVTGSTNGTLTPALVNRFAEHGLTLTGLTGKTPEWTLTTVEGITVKVRAEGLRMKAYGDGSRFYVRYSSNDYRTPDRGFPKPLSDNWWNMPAGMQLGPVDAVFTARDEHTYLFAGGTFVRFDARHRWWSEPMSLAQHWDSIPFDAVDAAFVGHDGATYLFYRDRFVRYSTRDYTEVDDGFPENVAGHWDNVRNDIQRTGTVDAALIREIIEKIDGVDVLNSYTYLFSGDQYVRYTGANHAHVDPGYPRLIDDLDSEPGMAAIDDLDLFADSDASGNTAPERIDAAFADRRTVYLFTGGSMHAVSASTYRKYDDLGLDQVNCAFIEDGTVVVEGAYFEGDNGWTKRSALEGGIVGGAVAASGFRPRTLRTVPENYRTDLDSVLMGADGNVYIFKGAQCFNTQLNRAYPLAEEWGRPRNTVYQENAVDAAFVGRDGKTYLFAGDQFISYTAPTSTAPTSTAPTSTAPTSAGTPTLDTTIEGDPKPIADSWGGLTSVRLAYVQDGVTYLFERPDETGTMRYVAYSGADYTTPDEDYPAITDDAHFDAPGGFPFPDAVLFEGQTMILLSGEECVSYNPPTDHWSMVRPIERLWPGFGAGLDDPDHLHTAFTSLDGATYFFYGDTYARFADHAFGPREAIRERWGLSKNPFVTGDAGIDAAFVWMGEQTYLFSGDHYVRYSGDDYTAIDPGYPKKTAVNLRQEDPFRNLPETFEDALDGPPDAVIGNDRTILILIGGSCHAVSPDAATTYPLTALGRVRNTILAGNKIDAALVADRKVLLFAGDQYVRYSTSDYSYVDDGYPKSLDDLRTDLDVPSPLPPPFYDGIDAAFRGPDHKAYLFKDKQYLTDSGAQPITALWGKVRNAFTATPGRLDAALVSADGDLYAFAGGQYVRYSAGSSSSSSTSENMPEGAFGYVDPGFPRTVEDDWGDLPQDFEDGPDGAFSFEGRTYLSKGGEYVRYSGDDLTEVDETFPQDFRHRWAGVSDYRISDLHTIVRFVDLVRSKPEGLADLFVTGTDDPYQYLGDTFGWDVGEIRWARRNSGLITVGTAEEEEVEIEFLLALVDLFATVRKFGTGPSEIYDAVWSKLYLPPPTPPGPTDLPDITAPADELYALLERNNSPADWAKIKVQLQNDLNVARRDALLAALMPHDTTSRQLFEQYLIDVDMGKEGTTSRVREAIAATQLYIHRYLLDLEDVRLRDGADPDEVRAQVKTWWAWMKNYRIWEANRKVFLYPENYIRPELRPQKTPAFKSLEDDLLQNEITQDAVQAAYKRYLDEYTEVSRLAIAGGYVYTEDGAPANHRKLVLFGRTRTEPRRYYFRSAEFRDGERLSATWEPWQKVDAQIDAERVDPVHAFGRVFVFWPVVQVVPQADLSTTSITTKAQDGGQKVTAPPPQYRVRVMYSFRNLNGEWVAAQELASGPAQIGQITDVGLYVQASRNLPGGSVHDSIVVQLGYKVGLPGLVGVDVPPVAYTLTPELYTLPATSVTVPPARSAELKRIFDEPTETPVDPAGVVRFNAPADSTDGPWQSIDHKGGSFLCRPAAGPTATPPLIDLPGNPYNLPTNWSRIDAAFQLPARNGISTTYFFDNSVDNGTQVKGPTFISVGSDKVANQQQRKPTAETFGIIANNLTRTGVVDAALVRGDQIFLFSGDEYYLYSKSSFGVLAKDYPKKLAGNRDNLPGWPKIDLAISLAPNLEVFYSRDQNAYAISGTLGTLRQITDWSVPTATTKIDGVVFRSGKANIIFGGKYIRLGTDGKLDPKSDGKPDTWPKNVSDNPDLPQNGILGPSFPLGQSTVAFNNTAGTYTIDSGTPIQSRLLGRSQNEIVSTGIVNAAYLDGNSLFLISSTEYVRYTLNADKTVPDFIDANYPKALGQSLDMVFAREDAFYVFSGSNYGTLEKGKEPDTKVAMESIGGDWRCLPAGFPTEPGGALDGTDTLFIFQGAKYVAYSKSDGVLQPYESAARPNEIIRLTSSTASELNRRLLVGGVDALLDPSTQEWDEVPKFSATVTDGTTIKVRQSVANAGVPVGSHLDFDSSNGLYYWEIFFHAPLLIAQALNDAQRFDDARGWYEYVFDPTERRQYWRFLPFLAVDVGALVTACRADLAEIGNATLTTQVNLVLAAIEPMAPAFLQARTLTKAEETTLAGYAGTGLKGVRDAVAALPATPAKVRLAERVEMIGQLLRQYRLMGDRDTQLDTYLNDPFDPHAIAALRPAAYRRSTVMAYIDNLLDWGDMLFRQYTMESIDEARMLYITAYDLLGERPYNLGPRALAPAATYDQLEDAVPTDTDGDGDVDSADTPPTGGTVVEHLTARGALLEGAGEVHAGVANPYFYVPDNTAFLEYWDRVEDRLRKIRASLDIMGISRPVPLFEPPADVMALVAGAAKGAAIDQITAGAALPVPAYKFAFLQRRAADLADRLKGLAGDLLGAFERRDAEQLSLLQNRQESEILTMTRDLRTTALQIAREELGQAQAALDAANGRVAYYQQQIANGLSALQEAQIAMMSTAIAAHFTSGILKIGAAVASAAPQTHIGPFILGISEGGDEIGESLRTGAEVSESFGEGFGMLGELLGIRADQQSQQQDWQLQLAMAQGDVKQITHQVQTAELQVVVAQRELDILERQIKQGAEVTAFLTGKFAGAELYGWMVGRLSGLYFQTYGLAYGTARAAERAYQFESGDTRSFIQPTYWDSKRNGLMAAESLSLDLDRLAQAQSDGAVRDLEITKHVSLLALDPLAALALRNDGKCEFALPEELFDRDFPGHFRRQIRTVSVSFDTADGPVGVNATLTQLDSKTVMEADAKAVKYLLDPKGDMPASLRGDWRSSQQIALSDLVDGQDNNGLFELRYDDDRFVPFEGTGAVSRWRLEARRAPRDLVDVTITVKYTAQQGGDAFATAVKGMLKPYATAAYFDVATEFADAWNEFLTGDSAELYLPITEDELPGITGRQITGIYARYDLQDASAQARFLVNGDQQLALENGKQLRTPGLTVGGWMLTFEGDKSVLADLGLILSYRAAAQ
ncbi:hypothetical protein J4573_31575 [Actinomadura barringtoniae]|uniref:Hemopexin n=1 Tax=Actinomadura barringtoniae TaxID=1427535 RepID=A0A939PKB3_9ACTN|nr:hemopexin repeat-containing protein [Actinomadura barringtoniae]MBO2451668.1 hypothetical protein [Actinomadura barringtoniae]